MIDVDLDSEPMRNDPHPAWQALRSAGPVHRESGGGWLVVRHDAVLAGLRDARLGKDLRRLRNYAERRPYGAGSAIEHYVERWMEVRRPDAHARWRRLTARALGHRSPASVRADALHVADALLASLPMDAPFDVVERYTRPFPGRMIARTMGLPWIEDDSMLAWTAQIGAVLEPDADPAVRDRAMAAVEALVAVIERAIVEREGRGGSDLLSRLSDVRDGDERLARDEIVATALLLFLSGGETVAALIGNAVLAVLRHPEQRVLLRHSPQLFPAAVEETLRYDAPASIAVRASYADLELDGVAIPAGELVLLALASANRDEAVYAQASRFDLQRVSVPHLGFGAGEHQCFGLAMARAEAAVALERFLKRFPDAAHDACDLAWTTSRYVRGLERMSVDPRADAAARARWA